MHKTQIEMLLRTYEGAVVWSDNPDKEDALLNAINSAFSLASDERKAELFARLTEGGFLDECGVPRRIITQTIVDRWYYDHVFGPTSEELESTE